MWINQMQRFSFELKIRNTPSELISKRLSFLSSVSLLMLSSALELKSFTEYLHSVNKIAPNLRQINNSRHLHTWIMDSIRLDALNI
jgi:hypothetical protein